MENVTDIMVSGAGLAGLSAALALAQTGRNVTLAGLLDTRPGTRTVALLDGSMRFYEALDLRAAIEAQGAPLRVMRIVDDTGSLFRGSPCEFEAGEIGFDAFGWNIENGLLLDILAKAARADSRIEIRDSLTRSYEFGAECVTAALSDGSRISSRLLVACDGVRSLARETAGIKGQSWSYPQTALTAIMAHGLSHRDVSTEFHTREGPCTFVPLPRAPDGSFRSSLVWVMHPREARRRSALEAQALVEDMARASHHILGKLTLERGPAFVPMEGLQVRAFSAQRLALAGDAAHAFPPIGAQGLNLGLRDVAHLRDCVSEGHGGDPGSPDVLNAYARRRQGDVASRTFGVDLMNRSLLTHILPVDLARGLGLQALRSIGPLRRLAMREGIMPARNAPSMMRQHPASQFIER